MAYSDTIKLVTGDTKPTLTIQIRDAATAASGATLDENDETTWAPVNLTGATVKLRIRELGETTVKSTLTCSVTDGSNGKVATDWPTGTLDTAGTFEGEIEVTDSGGGIQTVYDLVKLQVRSDFD